MTQPLWTPSADRIETSNLKRFIALIEQTHAETFATYHDFYLWSIHNPDLFWEEIWDFHKVIGDKGEPPVIEYAPVFRETRFFPQARLNFAENLLRRRDEAPALFFWGEDKVKQQLSYRELHDQVAAMAAAFCAMGVQAGDRVAAVLPNMPATIVAMLATTALGAIWCTCSPDFGVEGIVDRFEQLSPKILLTVDGYYYAEKTIPILAKIQEVLPQLPTLTHAVVIPYINQPSPLTGQPAIHTWPDLMAQHAGASLQFERFPFNHPVYILFSSGTTGKPKCIVHGAGGVLLEHLKEHQLHCDIKPNDRLFYFTTTSWMMWHWLASALASEASLVLYDGSPLSPHPTILFDYAQEVGITHFGTSAKFIDGIQKLKLTPGTTHQLGSIRMICSTGSPLAPASFDYIYEQFKKDVCLSSISGGTDILGCFALGNPIEPVWRGELQTPSLGVAVEVFDEEGHPIRGQKGDLVCTAPFPSMPLKFWGDDGTKYHEAYFDRFPNIWCHGDFVEITSHKGLIIYGRSDALLKPGGVRIGTAEIYRQVEQVDEVVESVAVGQEWDNDIRVVLFVKLKDGLILTEDLVAHIKKQIRDHTTPRHVPAKILQVTDIPRTKSGKIVELAVREVIHDRPVKNVHSLANPESLAYFANRPELQQT